MLNRLQDKLGVSMFVITHNLNIVRHISARTAIMYLGRFVEQGPTDDIFANPRHPYTLGCEFHTRCPFIAAHCDTDFPPLQQVGDSHSLTCHYPREA